MYQLKLTTTESSSPTPGTIYLFSNNESFSTPKYLYFQPIVRPLWLVPLKISLQYQQRIKNCWNANSGNVLMW